MVGTCAHDVNVVTLMMIDCYRSLQGSESSPFISRLSEMQLCVQALPSGRECGVNFCSCADNVSPHIAETHCESSMHVYNPPKGLSLQSVIDSHPKYRDGNLLALHIKVRATNCRTMSDVTVTKAGDGSVEIRFDGTDKYYLYSRGDSDVNPDTFAGDRIVTRQQIERSLSTEKDKLGSAAPAIEVMLIDFVDEEDNMSNWAYLTTDAMRFIVDEGVRVVVVNTPSVDREVDGGCVSNHKVVFERPAGLVVELAQLSHLQGPGYGLVSLRAAPHSDYLDCGPCYLGFEFFPSMLTS
jgi:hypothetical protein